MAAELAYAKVEDLKLSALAVDLESLRCVEVAVSNFSDWGCCLEGEGLGVLNHTIGVRIEDSEIFQKGKITGRKNGYVTVVFKRDVNTKVHEKRSEPRYPVTTAAKVSDMAETTSFRVVITDASKSGCRIQGKGLENLPDDLLVYIDGFDKPVRGQVAWKDSQHAGLRLYWEGAKSFI